MSDLSEYMRKMQEQEEALRWATKPYGSIQNQIDALNLAARPSLSAIAGVDPHLNSITHSSDTLAQTLTRATEAQIALERAATRPSDTLAQAVSRATFAQIALER